MSAQLDEHQQAVYNTLTEVRKATGEHEDSFLRLSLIKAKLEAELMGLSDEARSLEESLRANDQRKHDVQLATANYMQEGRALDAKVAEGVASYVSLAHAATALTESIKLKQREHDARIEKANERLEMERLHLSATSQAVVESGVDVVIVGSVLDLASQLHVARAQLKQLLGVQQRLTALPGVDASAVETMFGGAASTAQLQGLASGLGDATAD